MNLHFLLLSLLLTTANAALNKNASENSAQPPSSLPEHSRPFLPKSPNKDLAIQGPRFNDAHDMTGSQATSIEERNLLDSIKHTTLDAVYKLAAKLRASPRFMFYAMGIFISRLTKKLHKKINLYQWLLYVDKHMFQPCKSHDELLAASSTFFSFFQRKFTDVQLAGFFRSLRTYPGLSNLGDWMQTYMATNVATSSAMREAWSWYGDTIDVVFKTLRVENEADLVGSRVVTAWLEYCHARRHVATRDPMINLIALENIVRLLKTTKPDQDLKTVFKTFSGVNGMEEFAKELIEVIEREAQIEAWAAKKVHPSKVYDELELGTTNSIDITRFIQWLRYLQKIQVENDVFVHFSKTIPKGQEIEYASILKDMTLFPDLETFSKDLRSVLYKNWAADTDMTPLMLMKRMTSSVATLSSIDPKRVVLLEYTKYFIIRYNAALWPQFQKIVEKNGIVAAVKFASNVNL